MKTDGIGIARCNQVPYLMQHSGQIRIRLYQTTGGNVGRMAYWPCGDRVSLSAPPEEGSHAL